MPRHDNIWDEIIPVRWGLVVGSTHGEGIPTTLVAQGRELDVQQCGSTNLRTKFCVKRSKGQTCVLQEARAGQKENKQRCAEDSSRARLGGSRYIVVLRNICI